MENSSVKLLHNVLFELSTGNFQCKSSQYFIGFPCCHEKKKKKIGNIRKKEFRA